MIRTWSASLEGRLVLRLSALLLAIVVIGLATGVITSYQTAAKLADDALAEQMVGEFFGKAAWLFPLIVSIVVLVIVWTVRSSLKPLRVASQQAAAITPDAIHVRLAGHDLPAELRPLVTAINSALDRLSSGFEAQRRFTADAAHELRTPLAILTAGLESLPKSDGIARLQLDAERMNRLVEQLLRVARLDAQPIDLAREIDLNAVASEVVERLAPLATSAGRSLAFEPAKAPALVRGDRDALGDAIRNLVENAIVHSPRGEEVLIQVDPNCSVSVIDRGPGVPDDLKNQVFERFWRSREQRSSGVGAGLGLSIVAEIARTHGGRVTVTDVPGGGANFALSLPSLTVRLP